ncbi:MAG: leucyl aminopeptidase family protein [Devosiaceae bacterium]|nr:leucyl aminopeptidase family protein [Devosiaceae bacterium]
MISDNSQTPIQLICLSPDDLNSSLLTASQKNWLKQNSFKGQSARLLALPDENGSIAGYVFGLGEKKGRDPLLLGEAAARLPGGKYQLSANVKKGEIDNLAFLLGTYRFERYKSSGDPVELFGLDDGSQQAKILSEAAFIARDLINIPANDLDPQIFEKYIRSFASQRKMTCKSIIGDDLLKQNFPMIHAVGRAAEQAPRLLDLSWGPKQAPKITLVGKGVTFDSGGLSIKPTAGMVLMKKDMGGAANILGLAHAIIASKLKLRLRILLPIVENSISANSFRPGDILPSRSGLNVEIGNTDAEGRLILADALSFASEDKPQMLIDMATLTGAARVALGPDLPPLYTDNQKLARELMELGEKWGDPLWHMPLWDPYDGNLSSSIADVSHISPGGFAGSVIAALFLRRFVTNVDDWVHLDIFGWAPKARPGRSQGGTDQGIRATFMMLKNKFT